MKMLLLGGNGGQWSAWDAQHVNDKDFCSGIESWLWCFDDATYAQGKSATPEFIKQFDLIIGNTNGDMIGSLLKLQQARRPDAKWVTLIEGSMPDYFRPRTELISLLSGSDLVNGINRHATDYFQAMTTARYEYIGIPYPAESVRDKFGPGRGSDIVLPTWLRDAFPSLMAALSFSLNNKIPVHAIESTEERSLFTVPSEIRVWPGMGMGQYLTWLSQFAHVFVDLDHRYTWKRNVLDCAAIGIPCISTRSGGQAQDFFPELMVDDAFSIKRAAELLAELYKYPHFWRECATVPIEKFEHLTRESMKKKLLDALN
jgi:hypothetical protein